MPNAIGHLKTITKHRHKVLAHCFKAGIPLQGLKHDLSKYTPTEFLAGVKYYQGGHRSPNESEREHNGYSEAWMHHKGRNKHHYEYWTDYNIKTKFVESVEMPTKYVVEMFCDRVAASKIYLGDKYNDSCPLNYWLNAKDHATIHPNTAKLLENLLTMLAEKGEEKTFKYLRNMIKESKNKQSN